MPDMDCGASCVTKTPPVSPEKKPWRRVLKYGAVAGAAWTLTTLAVLCAYGLQDTAQAADMIVVLGNQVLPSGEPSARLQSRLDRAAALYAAGLAPRILVSGGLGKEGHPEGTVMRGYLVERGVPEHAILVDDAGNNTYATAQHTALQMGDRRAESVIVVSHYYHLLRCTVALQNFGVKTVYRARAHAAIEWREPFALLRECVALHYYLLRSYPSPENT